MSPTDSTPQSYITSSGVPSTESAKGYLCPVGMMCIVLPTYEYISRGQEAANPYNGTVSFDNIGQSLELVFVIISTNTFTDLMYYTIDAEYMVAALCTSLVPTFPDL